MPGAKGSVIIDRFFSNSCQTNAIQVNLREETRGEFTNTHFLA